MEGVIGDWVPTRVSTVEDPVIIRLHNDPVLPGGGGQEEHPDTRAPEDHQPLEDEGERGEENKKSLDNAYPWSTKINISVRFDKLDGLK